MTDALDDSSLEAINKDSLSYSGPDFYMGFSCEAYVIKTASSHGDDMYCAEDHTFVVCAYGESPYLEECVSSVRKQSLTTRVLISTSTPNGHVRSVVEKFGVELVVNEGEKGIAHDWNCALSHAGTPLVTIAHQDDVYDGAYAETIVSYANRSSRPLLLFTDYGEIRMGASGTVVADHTPLLMIKRLMLAPLKVQKRWGSVALRRRVMSFGSPICCPSVTYCLPNLPSPVFHEGMRGGLDWDAWERASRLPGDFVYVTERLMHHRIHEGSETSAIIKDDIRKQEDLSMFERFWPAPVAKALNKLYGLSLRSNFV